MQVKSLQQELKLDQDSNTAPPDPEVTCIPLDQDATHNLFILFYLEDHREHAHVISNLFVNP